MDKNYNNYTNLRLYEEEINILLLTKERRTEFLNWLFNKYYYETSSKIEKNKGRI